MSPRTIFLVYRKELRETLRDRRTLIVMVLLPLALYPLMGVGISQWLGTQQGVRARQASRLGLRGPEWPALSLSLAHDPVLEVKGQGDANAVRRGKLDAVLELPAATPAQRAEGTVRVKILFDAARDRSSQAEERVRQALRRFSDEQRGERLRLRGLPPSLALPLTSEGVNLATSRDLGAHLLSSVLPLVLVLMVLLGAFYPAIDLTAGEKERGTLETLFVAPAARVDVVAGKFLAVATIALTTGLLNIASMGLTVLLGFGPALKAAGLAAAIPWSAVALTGVALLPTAFFFAALMIAVASLARSFKEAQNLLTPIYLACVLPAMASQLPGLELSPLLALVPVVNISLLARELISGTVPGLAMALALGSTLLYAFVALKIAARIYNSERLLFAPELARARRPTTRRPLPEPMEAGLVLLAVMALLQLVGNPLQVHHLIGGILLTEWVLIAGPVLLLVRLAPLDPRSALGLTRPRGLALLGAALIGISAWYLVGVIIEGVQQRVLPMPRELIDEMHRLLLSSGRPLALDLFALALSPAICEELLFRGLVLRASWPRLGTASALLLNGLLFGLFHMSIYRVFPTFLLGVVLAFLALRTGSLLPGILLHFLNNAAALVVGRYAAKDLHLPTGVAIAAAAAALVLLAVGLTVVTRPGARTRPPSDPRPSESPQRE